MEYSTSVQSENFEPAELKLVLSVVRFLHEIHWFITKEANQLHTNQNWKYWIYGTTLSKLTIKFKVCHDILHPFFRILDLDSRLGGYGTRVINSLFFKLIWKTLSLILHFNLRLGGLLHMECDDFHRTPYMNIISEDTKSTRERALCSLENDFRTTQKTRSGKVQGTER